MAGSYSGNSRSPMTDRILIFSDHRGCERFFLRFDGTADEFYIWLERLAHRFNWNTDWATIAWEYCEVKPKPHRAGC